ncbi:3-oxoacyl-[acyl-carrier-protein] synthase 3 [Polystyrenella longa]|uniref:3-oxoacyl-[acyl-carrier-protein] synthase 3 n=1 Tax=Polystyrenella longa TaxID=2528007 RepID=A0A518CNQ3_9PLAN|nr:ketoacyl-ACP synthase III [Polystyrenella longa]QDU80843.1 3-oxoacyl-[acyl-carrier-protein] synthase 3 [Polystyrenella longa]
MSKSGIEAIGKYIPPSRIDVAELGYKFDAKPDFIRRKIGFEKLARKASDEECSDLCVKAFEDVANRISFPISELDCIVVVTQNPDSGAIPHAAALVHRKIDAPPQVACFDISLGCTGFVHGLSVVLGFMRENNLQRGLFFTSDPYSAIMDPEDRDTAMLFGDAATCTVISPSAVYTVGKSSFATDSQYSEAIRTDKWGGKLSMDGNLVFRSVSMTVPGLIQRNLKLNGLSLEEVDLCLLHQGSKFIVDTVRSLLHLDEQKVPFQAGSIGNTVSSSIPLMLYDVLATNDQPDRILLAGFGVGLSAVATVITHSSIDL